MRSIADEEQEHYDNMPENLQYSERAEEFENNASVLSDAADTLESFRDELESIILPDLDDREDIELPDPDDLDSAVENIDEVS